LKQQVSVGIDISKQIKTSYRHCVGLLAAKSPSPPDIVKKNPHQIPVPILDKPLLELTQMKSTLEQKNSLFIYQL
jgi:hypothetical protein